MTNAVAVTATAVADYCSTMNGILSAGSTVMVFIVLGVLAIALCAGVVYGLYKFGEKSYRVLAKQEPIIQSYDWDQVKTNACMAVSILLGLAVLSLILFGLIFGFGKIACMLGVANDMVRLLK